MEVLVKFRKLHVEEMEMHVKGSRMQVEMRRVLVKERKLHEENIGRRNVSLFDRRRAGSTNQSFGFEQEVKKNKLAKKMMDAFRWSEMRKGGKARGS
ncbi:hypothetical protein [Planococcus sp. YIM B11945]|uniref:hypothetical protein n=1 Tax=Planococcus sp. YIM B11945 TaxID=3435410 RepID=UPI003D7DDDC1